MAAPQQHSGPEPGGVDKQVPGTPSNTIHEQEAQGKGGVRKDRLAGREGNTKRVSQEKEMFT